MDVLQAVQRVQAAAEANAAGDPAAHGQLLDEIHRLRLAVETPADTAMRQRMQPLQNLCLRLAIEYGILQYIASRDGEPVTAAEISRQTSTDELLICRIMRVVTHVGFCKEVDYATYASDERTDFIVRAGSIGAEKHHTDLGFTVGSKLVQLKREHGIHQFPEGHEKNPFEFAYGVSLFQYLEMDKEQKEAFDAYMVMRRPANAPQWFDIYPAKEELSHGLKQDHDAALIVDVGGGRGHELTKFNQKLPHIPGRLILQDLPSTIQNLPPDLANVEPMGMDFTVGQPIKGARIYYLRQVLHDWSDAKCQVILSHIVEAMDPEYSRLILDEFVLPNTGVNGKAAALDFLMMIFNSGIERTVWQWETLLGSVNLEIVKIWRGRQGTPDAIIEAKIRRG